MLSLGPPFPKGCEWSSIITSSAQSLASKPVRTLIGEETQWEGASSTGKWALHHHTPHTPGLLSWPEAEWTCKARKKISYSPLVSLGRDLLHIAELGERRGGQRGQEKVTVVSGKEPGPCNSENWRKALCHLNFSCSFMAVLAGIFASVSHSKFFHESFVGQRQGTRPDLDLWRHKFSPGSPCLFGICPLCPLEFGFWGT